MKSDAFTIHDDDFTRVMCKPNHFVKSYRTGILNFEEGIGNWRQTNQSIFQPKNTFRYNDLVAIPKIEHETIRGGGCMGHPHNMSAN